MAKIANLSLATRPGILIVGSSNVGKRTLVSRLLSEQLNNKDDDDILNSSNILYYHAWTINTKYYTADVTLWTADLTEDLCVNNLPCYGNLAAFVMVFDLNDLNSFDAVRNWVSKVDLRKFDVLLCIGNKVDLVEGHFARVEYEKRMVRKSEGFEVLDYSIVESEGIGLLNEENESIDNGVGVKSLCVEWCAENGIEYVEACAANEEFDKCLSVDGDSQGVERLHGALSAHMWPGMVLKSRNGGKVVIVDEPYLPIGIEEEVSDVESDFEFNYEVLSEGYAEPWNDGDDGWVSANGPVNGKGVVLDLSNDCQDDGVGCSSENQKASASTAIVQEKQVEDEAIEDHTSVKEDTSSHFEIEDLERLMSEIGGMRDSLRLMPDFQRREMAAKLALQMAAMFGGDSEDEG